MGEERKVYKVLVGKPEGKRPLGRPRRRWEDGIGMDLGEIGLEVVDWTRLAQDRDRWRTVVSAVMNLWVLAPRSYLCLPHARGRLRSVSPSPFLLIGSIALCESKTVPLHAMEALGGQEV
jgi:hypothetical protein